MKKSTILSVDDNEDDSFLLSRAFKKGKASLDLKIVNDGQEAIDYLTDLEPGEERPDLILLDLKMPRKDGFAVLDWLHQQPLFQDLRVAVFTSSQSSDDIHRAYQKGAEWYFVKPVALDDLVKITGDVARWTGTGDSRYLTNSPYYRAPNGDG